jgi:acyl carrier protein
VEPLLTNPGPASPQTMDRILRVFIDSLHLNLRAEEFSYDDKLDHIVGLDSVAVIEFVAALEKEFGITFEPEMLRIALVRDLPPLAAYIDQRVSCRALQVEDQA